MTGDSPTMLPKPFIFVLMPLDPKFNDIYKLGIKGAADEVGAYAERLDEQIFPEGMLDRIFNQISKADVIVADMTGRNPNVFYEVGYAHALGKIVLVTQDSKDVPFDLKHRQHTEYKDIDQLRRELARKLGWAISESRRIVPGQLPQRVSVRILDLDLIEGSDLSDAPNVRGNLEAREFALPIFVRNDSPEGLVSISHTYLFAEPEAGAIPIKEAGYSLIGSTAWISSAASPGSIVDMQPFVASLLDAPDGLTQQFRLPVSFSSIPPGAIETTSVHMRLVKDVQECNSLYRLRLHTPQRYYDYKFRLSVAIKE